MGPTATRFLDWLAEAGQSYWQVLPLSPVSESGSPYRSFSAFAGNTLLISPEVLAAQRLLKDGDLSREPKNEGSVDFGAILSSKGDLLRRAWKSGRSNWPQQLQERFERFNDDPAIRDWLDEWALFAALKDHFHGKPWYDWPSDIRQRESGVLPAARQELAREVDFHSFCQFLFFDQWTTLRETAHGRGIRFIGDLAIYVAPDSVDVWSNQEIFNLRSNGRPRTVAGVPPDYFSPTGQLWGNPLYRWRELADDDYSWWIKRLAWSLRLADVVRLDHFRGFASYWEVPDTEETAVNGNWKPGPGLPLFESARRELGDLKLIAEDLGIITEDVRTLRKAAGLPGMRVMQFAFGDEPNEHLPHRVPADMVIYTGTHDNNTASGWFGSLAEADQQRVLNYVGGKPETVSWSMIRAAWTSAADTAIAPVQDVLGLGSSARLNTPGEGEGQWSWRLQELPGTDHANRLRRLTEAAERQTANATSNPAG